MSSWLKAINSKLAFAPYFYNLSLSVGCVSIGFNHAYGTAEVPRDVTAPINLATTISGVATALFTLTGQQGMYLYQTSKDPIQRLLGASMQVISAAGCYFGGYIFGYEMKHNPVVLQHRNQ